MEEEVKNEVKVKKQLTINGITIYRILTYFAIYSVIGFLLETIFALIMYGKLESRQGFLYGPVCPIYGVGAVILIIALQKFKKNGYTIFLGGIIIGSIIEYCISWFGEVFLNIRWWDYTGKFLNINGRICLLYSIYWGIISIYLMKSLNPNIDRMINFFKKKITVKASRILVIAVTIFLFIDCIVSTVAIELFLSRVVVEKDLPAQQRDTYISIYEEFFEGDKGEVLEKIWSNKVILRAYPNIRITLEDGTAIYVREQYPEIQAHYYKFRN